MFIKEEKSLLSFSLVDFFSYLLRRMSFLLAKKQLIMNYNGIWFTIEPVLCLLLSSCNGLTSHMVFRNIPIL